MSMPEVDPTRYPQQLTEKRQRLCELLTPFAAPEPEVFPSPPSHYRLRAEFRLWHEGDDLYYVMFEPGQKHVHRRITECPMVSQRIETAMFELLDAIRDVEILRRKLFQVDFLSTLSGDLLISLLYHKPLDEHWQAAAQTLQDQLSCPLIGRSRKTKITLERDYVIERMPVGDGELIYQQVENGFTQPNGHVCQSMLAWAIDATAGSEGDLLELYCGNGNFTLALARNFRRVLATEISKTSVNSAHYNMAANGIENVDVVRMSSEDFAQALAGVREFRRLKDIDLGSYAFNTVLVDPPRAGLDDATLAQIQGFDNIVYISCNPETLVANLNTLCQTHEISRSALFDQFPYTHHMEAAVYLQRR